MIGICGKENIVSRMIEMKQKLLQGPVIKLLIVAIFFGIAGFLSVFMGMTTWQYALLLVAIGIGVDSLIIYFVDIR